MHLIFLCKVVVFFNVYLFTEHFSDLFAYALVSISSVHGICCDLHFETGFRQYSVIKILIFFLIVSLM